MAWRNSGGRRPLGWRAWKPKFVQRGHLVESLEGRTLLSTVPTGFVDTTIATSLTSPSAMAFAPDGRLFIAQQDGIIRVVKDGHVLSAPFASVDEDSGGERGLLGIAIDPNFASNHAVYVYYTAKSPNSHNRISKLTADGDVAATDGNGNLIENDLFDLPDVGDAIWHMGGAMHFGPDGKLYVSVGDYTTGSNAQNLNVPMGKILRLNSDGSIPSDNPFYNQTTGNNRAIWAYGLRNPFTTAFQPGTGLFYINDVGNSSREEVDQGAAGANYGWPGTEGYTTDSRYVSPLYAYPHSDGQCVVGGAFYTGVPQVFPSQYKDQYFFGDFGAGWVRTMNPTTHAVSNFATGLANPTSIIAGPDGALWYISRGQGTGGLASGKGSIHRIAYTLNKSPQITDQPEDLLVADGQVASFSVAASGTGPLQYQWLRDEQPILGATGPSYSVEPATLADNGAVFKCVVSSDFGVATSDPAALSVVESTAPEATITAPDTTILYTAGDVIQFAGTATDLEDGDLPASAYSWQIELHHDSHFHPVANFSGVTSGQFTIPKIGETSTHVAYRITLTVHDQTGLTNTVFAEVTPIVAHATLQTNIPGLSLLLDSETVASPLEFDGVAGVTRSIGAPTTQLVNGSTYTFDSWSDGGKATHDIAFPSADTIYTANYKKQETVYVSDLTPTETPKNGKGPIELDMSNGGSAAKDGKTLTLAGVTYAKGLGTFANSDVSYNLNKLYTRFKTDIGVDDEVGSSGTVRFMVYIDGSKKYDSGKITGSSSTKHLDLDVTGKKTLRLVVDKYDSSNSKDSGDWADAKLIPAIPPEAPPAAAAFGATATSATSVQLAWTDNSGKATGYRIDRSPDSGATWKTLTTTSATARSYTDSSGLTASHDYVYRLFPVNGSAVGAFIESTATTFPPPPGPVRLEAEDATVFGSDIQSDRSGFTGTGFVDFVSDTGEYVEWTINAPLAGTYTLDFHYSNGGSADRWLGLSVNSTVINPKLILKPTGSWSTWKNVTATVSLLAGTNTIRTYLNGSKGPDLDSMTVSGPSTVTAV